MKRTILLILITIIVTPSLFLLGGCNLGNNEDSIIARQNVICNYEQVEEGWTQDQVRNVMRGSIPLTDLTTYLLYAYDFETSNTDDDLTIYIQMENDLVLHKMMVYGFYTEDVSDFE